jgi:DNA uptake protein ComE-like DNA-binding protein
MNAQASPFRRLESRRGSVLIVVMWVSLGLVALTLVFSHSMLMAYRSSDNEVAGRQAEAALEGGAAYAEAILTNTGTPGVFPDVTTYQSEAVPLGDATFWFIGRDNNNPATTTPIFSLVDEASKLNLNTATESMLEALPGMTPDLAAAIIDWRTSATSTTTTTASAAGSFNYESLQPPYMDKNASFESVEELALVYGMDNFTLYGEDANLNGTLDPNEDDGEKSPPSDNANGTLEPGILEYVTVYTSEPTTKSDGTAKVDVSTAVGTAPGGAPAVAGKTGTAASTAAAGTTGDSTFPAAVDTLLTATFSQNDAQTFETNLKAAGTTPLKSVLQFYVNSKMTEDQFSQIADSIYVKGHTTGLVNVNTASATVLECLPGFDTTSAPQIVSARLNQATNSTSFTWIVPILGNANALLAAPYITGKSYQVSADVAAVGRNGRGYRRTRFVIDNSSGTPAIMYRRELSHLGWALGRDTRQTLGTTRSAL